ncbi:hypothetical protein BOX15_Mlig005611g1, partial [Macrostomum lignano]
KMSNSDFVDIGLEITLAYLAQCTVCCLAACSTMARSHQLPQEVSEICTEDGQLCPSLSRLVADLRPESQFHWLLLTLHCLMAECGFTAAGEDAETEEAEQRSQPDFEDNPDDQSIIKTELDALRVTPQLAGASYSGADQNESARLTHFDLPSSVVQQLRQLGCQPAVSVALRYSYRHRPADQLEGYALLKLLNEGGQVGCHCGVAPADNLPASACASQHLVLARYFGSDPASASVRLLNQRELSMKFKDGSRLESLLSYFTGVTCNDSGEAQVTLGRFLTWVPFSSDWFNSLI